MEEAGTLALPVENCRYRNEASTRTRPGFVPGRADGPKSVPLRTLGADAAPEIARISHSLGPDACGRG